MKNVKIWFYDNTKIGSDGYVSFTKSIDQKLGMKQVAAITDKFDNASSNKEMFKVLNAKLRSSKKYTLTEKQIENLMNPVKKFFNARDLVITHLEVVDVKGKKFVSAVASRVKRDSLGDVAKIIDRRVFWFGCRFEIHALTRDVKITCSTSAGVNPYFAVLSEENRHDNGTSFRAGMIKRIESDNVINESDRKKPISEKRKAQMKAAKETFKAKKAAVKTTVKVMEDLKETATEIENELANFEMPKVEVETVVEIASEENDVEEDKPAFDYDTARDNFLKMYRVTWGDVEEEDEETVDLNVSEDEIRRNYEMLHDGMYDTNYSAFAYAA